MPPCKLLELAIRFASTRPKNPKYPREAYFHAISVVLTVHISYKVWAPCNYFEGEVEALLEGLYLSNA